MLPIAPANHPGGTLWRYRAVPLQRQKNTSAVQTGELHGDSAADVRASLRRIGMQVIELKPVRNTARSQSAVSESGVSLASSWLNDMRASVRGHLCRRRQPIKAELYDSLATLLESGLPLLEALQTIGQPCATRIGSDEAARRRWGGGVVRAGLLGHGAYRTMLGDLGHQLRSGQSLGSAMNDHPGWFDPAEVAMVNAGQHAGTLPIVLRSLAERLEHSGELSRKLASALMYPMVITMVGLGVTVFLSVKTLPDLVGILGSMKLETPALTSKVMAIGQFIAGYWLWMLLAIPLVIIGMLAARTLGQRLGWQGRRLTQSLKRLHPLVMRRLAVAKFCEQLSQLLRSGVPITEALRVLAPTMRSKGLAGLLRQASSRIEQGEDLAAALDDPHWFDLEFRRLLEVGQAGGELDQLLTRLADRYSRQSRRLIDRLASLLEPAVILVLAALVGVVVMAAVLPLLKLQEVI